MRNRRECLLSQEREDFVAEARRSGCTLITERQKNRYIDEFLRFCSTHSHHASAKRITRDDVMAYAEHIERTSRKSSTAIAKMLVVLQWCRWLHETGRLKQDAAAGLVSAGDLVTGLKKE